MQKQILAFITLAFAHNLASAACQSNENVAFQCVTKKLKVIELCESKSYMTYSFGPQGKQPDIKVTSKRDSASTSQWSGTGPMVYSASVKNGNTKYTVYWEFHRSPEDVLLAGVVASSGTKILANVECDQSMDIINNLEGLDLPMDE